MGSGASAEAGVEGRKIDDCWKLGKKLGKGSFATVFVAHKLDPEDERMKHIPNEVAVKRIIKANVPAADLPLLGIEVEIMRKVSIGSGKLSPLFLWHPRHSVPFAPSLCFILSTLSCARPYNVSLRLATRVLGPSTTKARPPLCCEAL